MQSADLAARAYGSKFNDNEICCVCLHYEWCAYIVHDTVQRTAHYGSSSPLRGAGDCDADSLGLAEKVPSKDPPPSLPSLCLRLLMVRGGDDGHVSSFLLGVIVTSLYFMIGFACKDRKRIPSSLHEQHVLDNTATAPNPYLVYHGKKFFK